MRGIRLLVVALAVVTTALAVPARAQDEIVLTGRTSGWAYFTVPQGAQVRVAGAAISAKGRYGGFYAMPTSREQGWMYSYGEVLLRDLRASGARPKPVTLGAAPYLQPGTYRLYLLADGPTTVRIALQYPIGRTLTPRYRVRPTVTVVPLKQGGDGAWARTANLRVPAPALVAPVLVWTAGAPAGEGAELCMTPPGAPCPQPAVHGLGDSADPDAERPEADPHRRRIVQYRTASSGRYDFRYRVAHPLGVSHALGAVVALPLG